MKKTMTAETFELVKHKSVSFKQYIESYKFTS